MLIKYISNPSHIFKYELIMIERLILYGRVHSNKEKKILRNMIIPFVKVIWKYYSI